MYLIKVYYSTEISMLVLFSGTYAKNREGDVWQFKDEERNDPMLIITFTTNANLHHLSRVMVMALLKGVQIPDLFYLLYTLHTDVHGQVVL